jgi:hypothetical protein
MNKKRNGKEAVSEPGPVKGETEEEEDDIVDVEEYTQSAIPLALLIAIVAAAAATLIFLIIDAFVSIKMEGESVLHGVRVRSHPWPAHDPEEL